MTSKQFFKYLQEPNQLNDSSVVEMEQLIKQFPFFQTAHLLYLHALKRINPKLVEEKLPVESLYIADRSILYDLLKTETKDDSKQAASVAAPKAEAPATDTKPAAAAIKVEKTVTVETKVEAPKAETKSATSEDTAKTKTETTTTVEKTTLITVGEAAKNITAEKSEDKSTEKKKLSQEERKQNHENLVKDFFDIREEDNYQTVATNVADDGSIKAAAADFASSENVNQAVVVNEKKAEEKPAPEAEEKPKANADAKAQSPASVESRVVSTSVETETETTTTTTTEKKDSILDKIASIRKEKEDLAKKQAEEAAKAEQEAAEAKAKAEKEAKEAAEAKAKAEETEKQLAEAKAKAEQEAKEAAEAKAKAEEEAKKAAEEKAKAEQEAKEAAEEEAKKAAEAVATTVTTVVTETVTTTVEEKPAETTAEPDQELSAADKLLAKLNRYKKGSSTTTTTTTTSASDGNLIDKFLETDHHLDRNKEVAEGDMGQDSVKEPELYSEKLIKIYVAQKLYDKAIESYEQLCQKFPDKKEYLEKKIEEINKLKNNQ